MRALIVALGFLTRLPVPRLTMTDGDFATAIRCYPLVGLLIGVAIWVAGRAGAMIDPWTGALAALILWVAITGALHLDGLSDLADGLGAGHGDRSRILRVMADPHIGSFGTVTLCLHLLAKLVLLHALAARGWPALILIPFAARIGPLFWARLLPPLKPGLGAGIAGAIRPRDLTGWGFVLAAACVAAPALLTTPLLIAGFAVWLRRKLGGITGDGHGAGIELVESGLLLALILAGGLR
jgi:adenosylcobinamide-GDP ribazoletransferase